MQSISLNFITNVFFLNLSSNPISLTREIECRIKAPLLILPPTTTTTMMLSASRDTLQLFKAQSLLSEPREFHSLLWDPSPLRALLRHGGTTRDKDEFQQPGPEVCGLWNVPDWTANSRADTYFHFSFGSQLSIKTYLKWLYRFKQVICAHNLLALNQSMSSSTQLSSSTQSINVIIIHY